MESNVLVFVVEDEFLASLSGVTPELVGLAGMALITACGLLVLRAEYRKRSVSA